ncbi:UNVERIFIED_ORG: hypothetical protein GGI66_003010 [Rhizobium esperanzae]
MQAEAGEIGLVIEIDEGRQRRRRQREIDDPFRCDRLVGVEIAAGDIGRGGEIDDIDLTVERGIALYALAVAAVAG